MTTTLVIDTDVALGVIHEGRPRDIDDGFAIVEALNLRSIDLAAITTVFGNAPLADTDRVARELVRLKAATTPVYRGAARRLPLRGSLPTNEAVHAIAGLLEKQPLRIAAIGPLTNVGLLAHHYPGHLGNVEEIIVVAGRSPGRSFYIGGEGPVQDFNFENDVRAMSLLLATDRPLVFAGFELTSQVTITEADLDVIAARGSETARYLHRNSLEWARYWTRTFPQDQGFHPWDSAAITWITHPEYFTFERRGVRILPRQDKRPPWLECSDASDAREVTYLTGFAPGGAAAFVRAIVDNVY